MICNLLRALPLILLAGACTRNGVQSSAESTETAETAESGETGAAKKSTKSTEESTMPDVPLPVERRPGPGSGWDEAYDAVVASRAEGLVKLGVSKLTLGPREVEGITIPYFVEMRLHYDEPAAVITGTVIVTEGKTLEPKAGKGGLSNYLAGLDFPRKLQPAPLLAELACYFDGVVPGRWRPTGDQPFPEARVERKGTGAVLYLERKFEPGAGEAEGGGITQEVPYRLELRFDAKARFTVHRFRKTDPGGSWVELH